MVLMENFINQLIKTFEPSKRGRVNSHDEFLVYIFQTYAGRMNMCRSEKLKNKYIKERDSILQYVVKNKTEVLKHINR